MAKKGKSGKNSQFEALAVFLFVIGILAVLLGGGKSGDKKPDKPTTQPLIAINEKVYAVDGDTISYDNKKTTAIRLLGVNAPAPNECFGKAAHQRLQKLLAKGSLATRQDQKLHIEEKVPVERFERRWLYVYTSKTNINVQLAKEGLAVPYRIDKEKYEFAEQIQTAADEARKAKRGLYGACANENWPLQQGNS